MPRTTVCARLLTRRRFVAGTASNAVAALLAACGGEGATTPATTPAPTAGSTPPATATPVTAMSATTAATANATAAARPTLGAAVAATPVMLMEGQIVSGIVGVPDAWTKPPKPYKATPTVPGKGGKVAVFSILYNNPPTAKNENPFWQELEKRLGVTWEPNLAPSASYGEKSAAIVAGGDLGDLFYLNPDQNADGQRKLIQDGAFNDLTPYLSGAGLAEFPNLAQYPDYLWKNVAFKGKVYGVPKPVLRSGNIGFYRSDWTKRLGIAYPKNADEVYEMFTAFSKRDPDGNGQADTWGAAGGNGGWNQGIWNTVFRVPNEWRLNADGTLTRNLETDEFRRSVEFMRRLYAGGGYHPDTASINSTQDTDLFRAGKVGIRSGGYISFWGARGDSVRVRESSGPEATIDGFLPPGYDGGNGVTYNLSGFFGFTAIPSRIKDQERIKELLRILDYLAAPFGSEEYNFLYYGIDGTHNTVQPDGSRVVNDKGRSDLSGLVYMMQSEYLYYYPGAPGDAEKAQKLSKEILKYGVENPTFGLSSPTNNAKGAELRQLGVDRITAIVTGREPVAALDTYIRDWRSRGGDAIRKEYEQAIRDSK